MAGFLHAAHHILDCLVNDRIVSDSLDGVDRRLINHALHQLNLLLDFVQGDIGKVESCGDIVPAMATSSGLAHR